ncbi:MAG TPA: secretin N-terminal domain-containing protein [Pyrinomonadaceae bacterium]|nr:secretin N-terminal domain-containing protein [Pyrinomonadaceae bacterium]
MTTRISMRTFVSLLLAGCLLLMPLTVMAKKGDEHFRKGLKFENAQQWEQAAQEFTLALAADPSNTEYQLHFRRSSFNASQAFMQQGRALAEQRDYVGAFNSFRQAYGYDPVNTLAVSEMERMLRLQAIKDGTAPPASKEGEDSGGGTPSGGQSATEVTVPAAAHTEQLRIISYSGDLKAFIRKLADELNLNVVFDRQSFAQPRQIDLNLRDVTTGQALDYIFLQEGLFFQKLSRRTILVADQTRRAQYQQLVLRTFFLSNTDPQKAREIVGQAIPPSVGRPQTIVVPDKDTNTLTVRDTAENVRLIGDLLQSIDKERPEVVMDVNIYEVSKSDLMQLGNQIGTPGTNGTFNIGGSPGFSLLSGNGVINAAQNGVNLAPIVGGVPTALAAALVIPSSILTAYQSKNRAKLIASTQVHAFNNEESTARIGQRVPVQTAQAYPFGVQTGQPATGTNYPTGGFPVINYEPTGLTLKFTPLVYPNFDVQVKMSIESKDVAGASTLTPTFTERTITGTARVQNNRTMMLASVSTEVESNGRQGLPVLGGLPYVGRLFSSPTRESRQVDIVIAVTPRVLRAPAVTPRDEEMRPSGTLSNPTTGSLEAMIRDADREDAIAAARMAPKTRPGQVEPSPFSGPNATTAVNTSSAPAQAITDAQARVQAVLQPIASVETTKTQVLIDEPPPFVPAPKSLVNNQAATEVAALNTGVNGNSALTSLAKPIDVALTNPESRTARLKFSGADTPFKAGEKRSVTLEMNSNVALGMAVLTLRFDPRVVKINAISAGSMIAGTGNVPTISQSISPDGSCLVTIAALNGVPALKGTGVLLSFEIEALTAGDAGLTFDKQKTNLMATDGGSLVLDLSQGQIAVKQ